MCRCRRVVSTVRVISSRITSFNSTFFFRPPGIILILRGCMLIPTPFMHCIFRTTMKTWKTTTTTTCNSITTGSYCTSATTTCSPVATVDGSITNLTKNITSALVTTLYNCIFLYYFIIVISKAVVLTRSFTKTFRSRKKIEESHDASILISTVFRYSRRRVVTIMAGSIIFLLLAIALSF